MDMQSLSKYNDKYKYLLSVIDVFFEISTYRSATVKDGYSCELCISIDTRRVFETCTQTADLGAHR